MCLQFSCTRPPCILFLPPFPPFPFPPSFLPSPHSFPPLPSPPSHPHRSTGIPAPKDSSTSMPLVAWRGGGGGGRHSLACTPPSRRCRRCKQVRGQGRGGGRGGWAVVHPYVAVVLQKHICTYVYTVCVSCSSSVTQ